MKWTISNAVFVTEIDDEHKEIFDALAGLQKTLVNNGQLSGISKPLERLVAFIDGHFAHEERLMRAARYNSLNWHKKAHDAARKRVRCFASRIEQGDAKAGDELVRYLDSWLHDHTRLADRMMGAFLRNQQRCMCKVTFQAGTRPRDACKWVTANGDDFEARPGERDR